MRKIIETKYDVENLVQHKYQRATPNSSKVASAYEIEEIITQTCYAGTQVFYDCRSLHLVYETEFKENARIRKVVDCAHAINSESGRVATVRFREDELKDCPEDLINEIKNFLKPTSPTVDGGEPATEKQ
jgi:hypothetical protein